MELAKLGKTWQNLAKLGKTWQNLAKLGFFELPTK